MLVAVAEYYRLLDQRGYASSPSIEKMAQSSQTPSIDVTEGITLTAIGTTWQATLSTNERGAVERRPAPSRSGAFAKARLLLDAAERRTWHNGEVVSVTVAQSDE